METSSSLEIHPATHPSLEVRRAGFTLDHPYLEHCWTPILGPSSVLLLRRAAELWRDEMPAIIDTAELSGQFGLGRSAGSRSPFSRTVARIVRFRFAEWSGPDSLDIYTEVRPLRERDLDRVPDWCAARHDEYLTNQIEALSTRSHATPTAPAVSDGPRDDAAQMAQRLEEFANSQMPIRSLGRTR